MRDQTDGQALEKSREFDSSLVHRLQARAFAICSVESCTGGLIASRLTRVPGASKVYWGGWIPYDNSAKIQMLGLTQELLINHGAVSSKVAQALAEAGLALMRTRPGASTANTQNRLLCVSTTGIAGPDGGTPQKPVGLCWVGLASHDGLVTSREVLLPAGQTREQNQNEFAQAALELVQSQL